MMKLGARCRRGRARLFAFAYFFAAAAAAQVLDIPGYPHRVQGMDPREVAMLPTYCKYTQLFRNKVEGGGDKQEIARWEAYMGPIFQAMHHYCWGLMNTNRALLLARTPPTRQYYFNESISEFDYVLNSGGLKEDFVLLPEILSKKGENLIRLGKGSAAVEHLERAIAANPAYWPAYAQLSDYYKSIGRRDKAEEYVRKGLALSPDASGLSRRRQDLSRDSDKGR